ncbi:MAG: hypothetical protein ACMXYC_03205 [Candidatus Woesearchaeota archaeon]
MEGNRLERIVKSCRDIGEVAQGVRKYIPPSVREVGRELTITAIGTALIAGTLYAMKETRPQNNTGSNYGLPTEVLQQPYVAQEMFKQNTRR